MGAHARPSAGGRHSRPRQRRAHRNRRPVVDQFEPTRYSLLHAGRPLKRWRYVAVFDEHMMACAARVQVGPARQTFWALLTRADGRLRERTRMLAPRRDRAVELAPGSLRVRDGEVELELELAEAGRADRRVETRCQHEGGGEVWTRKQAGVSARGRLRLARGQPRAIDALAVIDDTAGYHARRTEWDWSAGVGRDERGRALAWNLVAGVNDPEAGSERAVWLEGVPSEARPVRFASDLSEIVAEDGSTLRFLPVAERRRRENLLLVSSDYRAPFGTFHGSLPGGLELAHGLGVVEHHRAKW